MKLSPAFVFATGFALVSAALVTRSLPLGLLPPLLVGGLVGQFVSAPAASARAKWWTVVVTVWAITLTPVLGRIGLLPSALAQLALIAVGVYVLIHREVTTDVQ